METLAYIHSANAYEESVNTHRVADKDLNWLTGLNCKQLSSSTWISWQTLALTLVLMSFASNAMALQRGNRGTQVSSLQRTLKAAGYYSGPVTGYYGSLTQAAVKKFQQAKGIKADGIAGTKTYAALGKTPNSGSNANNGNSSTNLIALAQCNPNEVAKLQNRLKALGYFNGPVTGYYGSLTRAAVVKFQKSKGLIADGVVGPKTNSLLNYSQTS